MNLHKHYATQKHRNAVYKELQKLKTAPNPPNISEKSEKGPPKNAPNPPKISEKSEKEPSKNTKWEFTLSTVLNKTSYYKDWTANFNSTIPHRITSFCFPLKCGVCKKKLNKTNAWGHYNSRNHHLKVKETLEKEPIFNVDYTDEQERWEVSQCPELNLSNNSKTDNG